MAVAGFTSFDSIHFLKLKFIVVLSSVFWLNSHMDEEVEIRGEYWVQNGQVDFADGDVGDQNHEGIAIEHVVGKYADDVSSLADDLDLSHGSISSDYGGVDSEAVSKVLWRVYETLTTGRDPDDEDEQKPEREPMSGDDADAYIVKELGCNADAYRILLGQGDARLYVMKYENWIAIRSHSVDVYGYTDQKRQEIASAVQDVIYEESNMTDDEYDPETVDIDIHDLSNNKYRSMTLAELLTPAAVQTNARNIDDGKNAYGANGKLKQTSTAMFRQDTAESLPQVRKNKSVQNKWNKAAQDKGVIPPGHELWRGTSEQYVSFSEWLVIKHPDLLECSAR